MAVVRRETRPERVRSGRGADDPRQVPYWAVAKNCSTNKDLVLRVSLVPRENVNVEPGRFTPSLERKSTERTVGKSEWPTSGRNKRAEA